MDYLGKGEMLTNRDVNKFVHQVLREISFFVHMEHYSDLSFQLMKHGTNTLHVAFIFLFSVMLPMNSFRSLCVCMHCVSPRACLCVCVSVCVLMLH